MVSKVQNTYDSGSQFYWVNFEASGNPTSSYPLVYGSLVNKAEFDYGTNAPGPLLRSTITAFEWQTNNNYLNSNLLELATSVKIQDGGGTQRAYTYYGYDETGLQSSGVGLSEQHATGESYPGNETSVHRWPNGSTVAQAPCNVSVSNGYWCRAQREVP